MCCTSKREVRYDKCLLRTVSIFRRSRWQSCQDHRPKAACCLDCMHVQLGKACNFLVLYRLQSCGKRLQGKAFVLLRLPGTSFHVGSPGILTAYCQAGTCQLGTARSSAALEAR